MKPEKDKIQNRAEKENVSDNVNKHRPEIRDDLDSREMEEQHYRGDDVTHNKKSHRNEKHTIEK